MTWNLAEIATLVHGQVFGDPSPICSGANPPGQAAANEITLLDDPKRTELIMRSAAMAVVTGNEIPEIDKPQIVVNDPHKAFAKIIARFRPPVDLRADYPPPTIDPTADVHHAANIGDGAIIGRRTRVLAGAVIMPFCEIGDDCVIGANTTLYEYTRVADRVTIHAGSVIGAHGFGYRQEQGKHIPSAQLGYVAIDEDVEIGACVTIDRGTYGATNIGAGTKIDNQVQIAHNCQIGKHNLLCSQVGIAGSCTTGDHVVMAGQVGLADHINIGSGAIIGAKAGVMEDFAGDQVYLGIPATTQREQMQIWAVTRKLPEIRKQVKQMRRELDQMHGSADAEPAADQKRAA